EGGTAGRERVHHGGVEPSLLFVHRRDETRTRNAFLVAQALVVSEPERTVLDQRSARRGAELVPLAFRLGKPERVREEVRGIQRVIAEELVDAAAHGVTA